MSVRFLFSFQICFQKCSFIAVSFFSIGGNVFVYGKLRVCGRGFSEGKSEAGKQATNFVLAKTSNFL
ncbi:MAG: hypothetical protein COW44_02530 [Flavobacteriaceae bacterium CG17_big_fil_post_rev_8_21_14_2_50_33_15]|nr:MAG: hypothetical protein COW44_02530 [Flavobacteriaceae bacterium CG17_big_fil_post_rev_8_21_14_2_50_33_15]